MANKRREFSEDEKADIIRRYEAGEELKAIHHRYHCSNVLILSRLRDWGVVLRTKKAHNPHAARETGNGLYKKTPCRCPCCKEPHTLVLFWTGNLPAPKFCKGCSQNATRPSREACQVMTHQGSHPMAP